MTANASISPSPVFSGRKLHGLFEHTAKLDDNYEINKGNWVLYALRNDYNEIVGTIAAGEDYHFGGCVQLEYVAIREDCQQRGLGKLMIKAVHEEVARHTRFKNSILSTIHEGGFYEKAGMNLAGTLTATAIPVAFIPEKFNFCPRRLRRQVYQAVMKKTGRNIQRYEL